MEERKNKKIIAIILLLIVLLCLAAVIYIKPFGKFKLFGAETLEITCPDEITVLAGIPPIFDKIVTINGTEDQVNITATATDFTKPGDYKVNLKAATENGKCSGEKTITVKVISREDALNGTEFVTGSGHPATYKDGIFKVDGLVIANKSITLSPEYGSGMTKEMLDNFTEMKNAAEKDGIKLFIMSSFRPYSMQKRLYDDYVTQSGKADADTYSARPGSSEHQIGDTVDLNLVDQSFENTKEGKWLDENAAKHGFIMRYPKGKDKITGYIFEPWHFKFVGKELAEKIYQNGTWSTLEEHYGLPSNYEKQV